MEVTQELTRKLAALVAKEIDLDAMAKRLAPKIAKEIEKGVMVGFSSLEWRNWAEELAQRGPVGKAVEKIMLDAILARLK